MIGPARLVVDDLLDTAVERLIASAGSSTGLPQRQLAFDLFEAAQAIARACGGTLDAERTAFALLAGQVVLWSAQLPPTQVRARTRAAFATHLGAMLRRTSAA